MAQHQPRLSNASPRLPPALIGDINCTINCTSPSATEVAEDSKIQSTPTLEASAGSITNLIKTMENVNSSIGSPSGNACNLRLLGLGDDTNPRGAIEQRTVPPTSPSTTYRSTSPPPVLLNPQVQPTHDSFTLDDFSATWNNNPKHWDSVLEDILNSPPAPLPSADQSAEDQDATEEITNSSDTNKPVKDKDLTLDQLCDAIEEAARSISHYKEAALRLTERCHILKNTLKSWEGRHRQICLDPPLSTLPAFVLTQVVSKHQLELDLIRVLEFLRSLKGRPLEFFQDSSLFPRVFQNAAKFLVFPRLFNRYSEPALRKVDKAFEIALHYDRVDMLAARSST